MKKIVVFLISLLIVSQVNASSACVPGVGYTIVASVADIATKKRWLRISDVCR